MVANHRGKVKETEMKITKQQLKDIIREELAEAKQSHQHFKFSDNRSAEDFAQEVENSALATARVKGDTVAIDTSKIRKARTHKAIAKIMTKFGGSLDFKITFESLNENRSNYYFLMDPQGMRGEDGFYKRLSTNDESQFEFGHVYSATGWKNKAEAQRTLKRVKSSSRKYRNANLKVVRGDEIDESIVTEANDNINISALSSGEIQLAIGLINYFGTGSHPMATKKTLAYFKVDYLADIIQKNKNRLEATARKHLAKLLKKLSGGTNEDVEEGKADGVNKEIFFGLQKLISKNAKNNKLKGYSSEVSHAVTDILVAVEEDRLAIYDVFNGLKTITKKIKK